MGRIERTFGTRHGRKVLVTYLCVGDPNLEESVELALGCVEAGADILELGVPFSDPSADGPVIARASERALQQGGSLRATLRATEAIRKHTDAPIVLFGYYNPVFTYGDDQAAQDAARAGADGFLLVDLPVSHADDFRRTSDAHGLRTIPLIAPTTSPKTVAKLAAMRQELPLGFVYYVSVAGVTGNAKHSLADATRRAETLEGELSTPVVVGFGIDSPERASSAASGCSGVVVGSVLVSAIASAGTPHGRLAAAKSLVQAMRTGLDSPSESATASP